MEKFQPTFDGNFLKDLSVRLYTSIFVSKSFSNLYPRFSFSQVFRDILELHDLSQ